MSLTIPKLSELTFDEASHTYRLDGLIIPSVTTLMKPLSEAYYGGVDAKVLSNAADRGSAVHSAIDLHCRYGVIDIEPELEGYFEAFGNLYRSFCEHLTAKKAGTLPASYTYPTIEDGIVGLKFIRACVESNQNDSVWTAL